MTMITPSYLGETIEYSSLHACRSTLEDPTIPSGAVASELANDGKKKTTFLDDRNGHSPLYGT